MQRDTLSARTYSYFQERKRKKKNNTREMMVQTNQSSIIEASNNEVQNDLSKIKVFTECNQNVPSGMWQLFTNV